MKLPTRHLSRKGAQFIARYEGFRPTPYNDAAGNATIGYGHLLHMGHVNSGDGGMVWGRAKALRVLQKDAEKAAAAVRAIRPRVLKQSRFDALVSFVFNLGTGILDPKHDIGKAVRKRAGRVEAVHRAILEYDVAGGRHLAGLKARRRAEARLWKSGRYS